MMDGKAWHSALDWRVPSSKVLLTRNLCLGAVPAEADQTESLPSWSFWSKMGNAGENGL